MVQARIRPLETNWPAPEWKQFQGNYSMYYSPTTRNPSGEIILLSFAKETSDPKNAYCKKQPVWSGNSNGSWVRFYLSLVSLSALHHCQHHPMENEEWIELSKGKIRNKDKTRSFHKHTYIQSFSPHPFDFLSIQYPVAQLVKSPPAMWNLGSIPGLKSERKDCHYSARTPWTFHGVRKGLDATRPLSLTFWLLCPSTAHPLLLLII